MMIDDADNITLIDYGNARYATDNTRTTHMLTTINYASVDTLLGMPYSPKSSDVWYIVTHRLISGRLELFYLG